VRIIGASEEWQDVVDASFFYLYCTVSPSSPQSMAPFGLSRRDEYKGHAFWDTESFMLNLPMFTDPPSAKNLLDYRFDRFKVARHNAMINGFNGIQFPCQSGVTGDEVTRVSAGGAAGIGEHHFSIDIAMGFVAYAQVSGDPVFLRERAWPVVREIAEWILTRVEKTPRGYEIRHVTGIDEGIDNVNNDSFTNSICKLLLIHADRIARQLGYTGNPDWKTVAENIFIPINKEYQFIEQFDGCKIKNKMGEVALMAIFPYGYLHTRQLAENTIRFLLDNGLEDCLIYTMLSGFMGVYPAILGDRKTARKFFDGGNLPFFVEPYRMCTEWSSKSPYVQSADQPATFFITGRGSLLTGLMMGLTRIDIWQENFDDWFSGHIVMPEGWDGIVLEKVFLRGKPARIIAQHGAPRATVEWL